MKIMKAKIVWFPEKLSSINFDSLENKMEWDQEHLKTVRKFMEQDGLLFPGVFKDGEIICQDTEKVLLDSCPEYKRLHQLASL